MNLKLREFRLAKGLSQREFAREFGKSSRTIQQWECGDTYPNADAIWKICEFFGTDPNTLLGWYDEHPKDETASLESDETALLSYYHASTSDRKGRIVDTARDFALVRERYRNVTWVPKERWRE